MEAHPGPIWNPNHKMYLFNAFFYQGIVQLHQISDHYLCDLQGLTPDLVGYSLYQNLVSGIFSFVYLAPYIVATVSPDLFQATSCSIIEISPMFHRFNSN